MIIERYLAREILQSFAAVMVVLLLIFVGRFLSLYLAWAVEGFIASDIVVDMLLLRVLSAFSMLLPGGFFIALLLAFGRLYRDNEMTAMAACTVTYGQLFRFVFKISVMFSVLVAVATLYLTPWADRSMMKIQERVEASADIESLIAGQFNVLHSQEDAVFYIESISQDRRSMQNVFVQSNTDGLLNVFSAKQAYQWVDPEQGDRYLVLVDGFRYVGEPGSGEFTIQQYAKSAVRMQDKDTQQRRIPLRAVPTEKLFDKDLPAVVAELQWRIAIPLSVLFLGILALPLSQTSPRQGRFARLFVAILIYVLYNNTLTIARTWVQQERVPMEVGMWWVHGLIAIVTLGLLARQMGTAWIRACLNGTAKQVLKARRVI